MPVESGMLTRSLEGAQKKVETPAATDGFPARVGGIVAQFNQLVH